MYKFYILVEKSLISIRLNEIILKLYIISFIRKYDKMFQYFKNVTLSYY
jgi:hypothetical protein